MGEVVDDADRAFGKTGKGKAVEYLREDRKIRYALIVFGLIVATATVVSQFVR